MNALDIATKTMQTAIKSVVDTIKTTTDTTKTTTDNVNTLANKLNTSLGTTTDSANSDGSVHAKLKDLKANMPSEGETPFYKTANLNNGAALTAVNVSGSGLLHHAMMQGYGTFKVTIDNSVVYWVECTVEQNHYHGLICAHLIDSGKVPHNHSTTPITNKYMANFPSSTKQTHVSMLLLNPIPFKTALKVEISAFASKINSSTVIYELN